MPLNDSSDLKLTECLIEFSFEGRHLFIPREVDDAVGEHDFHLLCFRTVFLHSHLSCVLYGQLELILRLFLFNTAAAGHLGVELSLEEDFLSAPDNYKVDLLSVSLGEFQRKLARCDLAKQLVRLDNFEGVDMFLQGRTNTWLASLDV